MQAGASATGDLVPGSRTGVAGVQSVGPGVRHGGESGEQLGHLDAEDVGEGERAVDGDRLAGVLDLGVVRPAQPGLPGHGGLGHAPAFPDFAEPAAERDAGLPDDGVAAVVVHVLHLRNGSATRNVFCIFNIYGRYFMRAGQGTVVRPTAPQWAAAVLTSDYCGLTDLAEMCPVTDDDRRALVLTAGWSGRWTAVWRVAGRDVTCA